MKKTQFVAFLLAPLVFVTLSIFYHLNIATARGARFMEMYYEENLLYSEMYDIGKCAFGLCVCAVSVRKDGTGVDITAMDREWLAEYLLWQKIRIVKNPSGNIEARIEHWMVPRARGSSIAIESAHDVFAKECREDAGWLPPEVKKLFFGHYGIE